MPLLAAAPRKHEPECPTMVAGPAFVPEDETRPKRRRGSETAPEKERRIDAALEDLLESHLVKFGKAITGSF